MPVSSITEEENKLLENLPGHGNYDVYIQNILNSPHLRKDVVVNKQQPIQFIQPVIDSFTRLFNELVYIPAIAMLVIFVFGGYRLYTWNEMNQHVTQGNSLLKENWYLTGKDPRPAGGLNKAYFLRHMVLQQMQLHQRS